MKIFQKLVNFLFPAHCLKCNGLLKEDEALFCRACQRGLPVIKAYCRTCGNPLSESILLNYKEEDLTFCGNCLIERPPFKRVYLAFKYESPIRDLIIKAKFGKDFVLAYQLGKLLRSFIALDLRNYDLLLPVPLHPVRERERGYNQSLLILWGFAGIRLQRNYLFRIRNTLPQSELNLTERRNNIKDAFYAKEIVRGKRILLVDDVMTTGETLKETARTLKKAGAEEVHVLAVSRAIL